MSLRSAINFGLLLAFRKYSGELQFNHQAKELTIKVRAIFFISCHFWRATIEQGSNDMSLILIG